MTGMLSCELCVLMTCSDLITVGVFLGRDLLEGIFSMILTSLTFEEVKLGGSGEKRLFFLTFLGLYGFCWGEAPR